MFFTFIFSLFLALSALFTAPSLGYFNANAIDLVFPLKADKSVVLAGSSANGENAVWCHESQSNCHHDYNAADIFAVTGTTVVAAVSGKITQAHQTSSVGYTVHILGDDGTIYYHAHMGGIKVSIGQNVKPGDEIGAVGTSADASGTQPHLHFDMIPNSSEFNGLRPNCSDAACQQYPFINPQPQLIAAFNGGTLGGPGGGGALKSNCVITKIGNPPNPPVVPPECPAASGGGGVGGDGTPGQPGPKPPDYPPDLRQAIINKFGITMNGFDDEHLRWAWEKFWDISGSKFTSYVQGAIVDAQPGQGTSRQVGCPPSPTVQISQYSTDYVFKFLITHELGHAIQICHPRDQVKYNEHENARATEGGVSRYGETLLNEDYADTMAYAVNPTETMSSNGGPNIAVHPFFPAPAPKPLHYNNVVLPVLFNK